MAPPMIIRGRASRGVARLAANTASGPKAAARAVRAAWRAASAARAACRAARLTSSSSRKEAVAAARAARSASRAARSAARAARLASSVASRAARSAALAASRANREDASRLAGAESVQGGEELPGEASHETEIGKASDKSKIGELASDEFEIDEASDESEFGEASEDTDEETSPDKDGDRAAAGAGDGRPAMPIVKVTAKDIATEEDTWALYRKWCSVFNKQRDRDQMERRFPIFKHVAKLSLPDGKLGLYADGLENSIECARKLLDARCPVGSQEYQIKKRTIDLWEEMCNEIGCSF